MPVVFLFRGEGILHFVQDDTQKLPGYMGCKTHNFISAGSGTNR